MLAYGLNIALRYAWDSYLEKLGTFYGLSLFRKVGWERQVFCVMSLPV